MTSDPSPLPADTIVLARALAPELLGVAPADLYDADGSRLYEMFGAQDTSEIAAIVAAVRATDGDILELACGGGRVAVPLLALGRRVVGLDLSPTMVDLVRARLAAFPPRRVPSGTEALVGDMAAFDLPTRFGAIVLAATSISLLDETARTGLYASVLRHLSDDGRFLVTTIADREKLHPGGGGSRFAPVLGPDGGDGVAVLSEAVSANRQRRTVAVLHLGRGIDGAVSVRLHRSDVHLVDTEMLRAEAGRAGLRIIRSRRDEAAAELVLHELVRS